MPVEPVIDASVVRSAIESIKEELREHGKCSQSDSSEAESEEKKKDGRRKRSVSESVELSGGDRRVAKRPCLRRSDGHLILDGEFASCCAVAFHIEGGQFINLVWLVTLIYHGDDFKYGWFTIRFTNLGVRVWILI